MSAIPVQCVSSKSSIGRCASVDSCVCSSSCRGELSEDIGTIGTSEVEERNEIGDCDCAEEIGVQTVFSCLRCFIISQGSLGVRVNADTTADRVGAANSRFIAGKSQKQVLALITSSFALSSFG